MAIQSNNINDLVLLLRNNGDKILDASSKLCLSASLLCNLNKSLRSIIETREQLADSQSTRTDQYNLEFVYDFIQKTLALKMIPNISFWNNEQLLDVRMFKNLKLLEIRRLSVDLIKGIKHLRAQIEYLICVHSLRTLREILESCGADTCQGNTWKELKRAVFSYNNLISIDNSLKLTPWLHSLDLSHNQIQNAQTLNCLPNLKYLNISYNHLESVPAFSGQLCNHLQVLVLRNNFIENIYELSMLTNLYKLDLSNNFLLEHSCLMPLTSLPLLRWINLAGNPLSFHHKHRTNTVYYLHFNISTRDFILENAALSKAEKQLVGSISRLGAASKLNLESISFTENGSIVNYRNHIQNTSMDDTGMSSDIHSSTSSITVKSMADPEDNIIEDKDAAMQETLIQSCGMQDSGIVAERRPTSPSQLSIGSASSLTSDTLVPVVQHESDIEVLSNPSQSSIEVIVAGSGNRYGGILIQEMQRCNTKMDLKNTSPQQLHRSL